MATSCQFTSSSPNSVTLHYSNTRLLPCHVAIDDPRKVVKVVASDGKTGDTRDISYTNCKVIGNGSFGVVFQAKLTSDPESGEDIAIKKVLQDKRFKVRHNSPLPPGYTDHQGNCG